eukprot:11691525-Alexandrium_andersonii.AAC.1
MPTFATAGMPTSHTEASATRPLDHRDQITAKISLVSGLVVYDIDVAALYEPMLVLGNLLDELELPSDILGC